MLARLLTVSCFCFLLQACGGGSGGGSDDVSSSSTENNNSVTPAEETELEKALRTGDAREVSQSSTIVNAALDTIDDYRTQFSSIKRQLLQLNADGSAKQDGSSLTSITWDVTHDAAQLKATFGINDTLLISNASQNSTAGSEAFGIIGQETEDTITSRYIVLGSNPMRTWQRGFDINDDMQQWLQNSIEWLTGRENFDETPLKVRIAHMSNGYYFPDQSATRNWLDTYYPDQVEYNAADSCNGNALIGCVQEQPDLLIISQEKLDGLSTSVITNAIAQAQAQGTAVLYLHTDGHMETLGTAILNHLNVEFVGDNYWDKYYLSAQNMSAYLEETPEHISEVETLLNTLSQSSAQLTTAFDWSQCVDDDCSAMPNLQADVLDGTNEVRSMMSKLDQNKTDIFADSDRYQLEKLLALLGDHYRQSIQYPMTRGETSTSDFIHAMYADMSVYNVRSVNPVPTDLGNFSRTDFSHVTPTNKTISMTTKRYFRAAGVYAMPGQTVQVTRLDSSDVTTKVFVNSIRSGSTHWFGENQAYNRPKYLQSTHIEIQPGETLAITSPYGGPIQLEFGENGHQVEFRFEQIGLHPFWNGSEDNQSFEQQLSANDFDWAELSTAGFEVHSKTSKMVNSMNNWGGTAADMALATERYVSNLPHVLAGFQGPGIDVIPEIHDFANDNGFTVTNIDIVKHMNADQPTCGWGCSGNPYDAGWDFSPIGHGDIHELGHGLERSRFRFEGWPTHASTNPYSYHSKSHYYQDTGNEPDCQSLPFKELFDALQAAQSQADPTQYMIDQGFTDWSHGAAIYIQMMMATQAQGVLQDGWMLLPRLHIVEREFGSALSDETTWDAKKAALGFSTYSLAEANAINKNDWLNIALSKVTGLAMDSYLTMWGFPPSTKAQQQVTALSLPAMNKTFYASEGTEFCKGFDKPAVAIDGTSAWPL